MVFVYIGVAGIIGIAKYAYDYITSEPYKPVDKRIICNEIKNFDINQLKKVEIIPKDKKIITHQSEWHDEISKKLSKKFANCN